MLKGRLEGKKKRTADMIKLVEGMTENGVFCIDVRVGNDLYDPLSYGKNNDLNNDIYDFIERQAGMVPSKMPIKVRFHGIDADEAERKKIEAVMRRHYEMKMLDAVKERGINLKKILGLSVFGVAVLTAYFIVSLTTNAMATEILSIIGTFSLWEATGAFLLDRPRLKREHASLVRHLGQTVEFYKD